MIEISKCRVSTCSFSITNSLPRCYETSGIALLASRRIAHPCLSRLDTWQAVGSDWDRLTPKCPHEMYCVDQPLKLVPKSRESLIIVAACSLNQRGSGRGIQNPCSLLQFSPALSPPPSPSGRYHAIWQTMLLDLVPVLYLDIKDVEC